MDHEDRPEGRLPSHTGLRQPLKILPPYSGRSSLSVPCPPVWALDDSSGIHQDVDSCGSAVAHSGRPCPILTWTTELCVRILTTESGTCTINFSTSSVFGLNDQLKHVNVTTLTHSGLLVLNFNLEQALFLPWTLSYQFSPLSYPVCLHQRSCLLAKFHPSAGCHICPVLTQWLSSHTLSPVLVQSQVVSPSIVVGYTNPVGYGFLTYIHWFHRRNVMTGVPLHLPEPSLFFFTVASLMGWSASWIDHQISGLCQLQNHNVISTDLNWKPYDLHYFIGDFSSAVNLWTSIAKTVQQ